MTCIILEGLRRRIFFQWYERMEIYNKLFNFPKHEVKYILDDQQFLEEGEILENYT